MKLLLDQDIYTITARYLRELGHDVLTAADLGASRAADEDLLVFVTRDRDFGSLVFVRDLGSGVIYLRLSPSTVQAVHTELERVLQSYSAADLQNAFVVVEPGRHRFRRLLQ